MVWHGMHMVLHGMVGVWYGRAWYGMVWHGMVGVRQGYGMTRHSRVCVVAWWRFSMAS